MSAGKLRYIFGLLCVGLWAACAGPQTAEEPKDAPSAAPKVEQVQHGELGPVAQVSVGGQHACARHETGKVSCWGRNHFGQLGDGTRRDRWWSAPVAGLEDAVDIAAGAVHTCALHETGTISCWGAKVYGFTGDAGNWGERRKQLAVTEPTPVKGMSIMRKQGGGKYAGCFDDYQLDGVVALSASPMQTCAVHESGGVACWGADLHDTRRPPGGDKEVPCPLPMYGAIHDAEQISLSLGHGCAITASGQVRCWGYSATGEDGAERAEKVERSPFLNVRIVDGLEDAKKVASGARHNCAIDAADKLVCWGQNAALFPSTQERYAYPTPVPQLGAVVDVASAQEWRCAVTAEGKVGCWGRAKGVFPADMGEDEEHETRTPQFVAGLDDAVQVALGGYRSFEPDEESGGRYWGGNRKDIDHDFACAVTRTGEVNCWGDNTHGQLGRRPASDDDGGDEESVIQASLVAFEAPADLEAAEPEKPEEEQEENVKEVTAGERYAQMLFGGGREDDDVECPAEASFGDESAPNELVMSFAGQRRAFNFERVAAAVKGNQLEIYLPELRYHTGPLDSRRVHGWQRATLRAELPEDGDFDEPLALSIDDEFPRQLGCFMTPPMLEGTLRVDKVRLPDVGESNGFVSGRVEVFAGSPAFGHITVDFETDYFAPRMPATLDVANAKNAFEEDGEMITPEDGSFQYDAQTKELRIGLEAWVPYYRNGRQRGRSKESYHGTFENVALHPGTYVSKAYKGWDVLHLERFDRGGLRGTHRRVKQKDNKRDRERESEKEREIERKRESEKEREKKGEPPGLLVEAGAGDGEAEGREEMPSFGPDEGELMARFETSRLNWLPQLQTYEYDDPAFESLMEVDAQPFVLKEAPDAPETLVLAQYYDMESLKKGARPNSLRVYRTREASVDGQKRWQATGQDFRFDDGSYRSGPNAWWLSLDAQTLRPKRAFTRRSGSDRSLVHWLEGLIEVDTTFGDEAVQITATNEEQGDDALTLDTPDQTPVLDSRQLFSTLPHLPLEPGYATKWKVFDIEYDRMWRASTSGYSGAFYEVAPRLVDAVLQVKKAEELDLGSGKVQTYRVAIEVPELPDFTGTLWVEQSFPHRMVAFSKRNSRALLVPYGAKTPDSVEKALQQIPLVPPETTAAERLLKSYETCEPTTETVRGVPDGFTLEYEILGPKDGGCQLRFEVIQLTEELEGKEATCTLPADKEIFRSFRRVFNSLPEDDNEFDCAGSLRDAAIEMQREREERRKQRERERRQAGAEAAEQKPEVREAR